MLRLFLALASPLLCLAKLYEDVELLPTISFDFVICGGGTAGSVLANRLTENANYSVLLLEAGPSNVDVLPSIVPFLGSTITSNSPYSWNYTTTAQPGLNGRSIDYPRGHMLGGSSSINYMLYTRGSSDDWDNYASTTGDSGWSWSNVQKYFRKNELWSLPADNHSTAGEYDPKVHSVSGVNSVTLPGYPQPIDNMLLQTTKELPSEFPFNLDMNSGNPLGVGWAQSTIDSLGQRSSSATSYLGPKYIDRPNLHVLVHAQVSRLVQTAQSPATFKAVEFKQGNTTTLHIVTARKEVILSAGSIGSPRILLSSGIGDKRALAELGIASTVHLPDVGQNLADQATIGVYWEVNSTDTIDTLTRNATLSAQVLDDWLDNRQGRFVESILGNFVGWSRLSLDNSVLRGRADPASGPKSPHYEILPLNGIGGLPLPPTGNFFNLVVALLCPVSRGSVTLSSSDPFAPPLIDPGFLNDPLDLEMMREGIKILLDFAAAPTWRKYIIERYQPFPNVTTDAAIEAYIRNSASTIFHPLGSNSMSAKDAEGGVVDPDLRVKGIPFLRVVDGSVLRESAGRQYTSSPNEAADLIKEARA
ncbi:aryl-alcohol oxidase precursor [Roridomyces roridus]|uniref:Aryl-alcohol oxidase n=1 Tax=Roridomyces roridus TaxID=1738132 RepID=A0AAD7C7J9_9AGAR|nr:aryl-alcohol oxidase precursor [Roridomyces roridus]